MDNYVTGATIRALRERQRLTQAELAARLMVSDKAVSKWETGRGLPDITLLEPLGRALHVSVPELLSGKTVVNGNRAANLLRTRLYVCPVCGNVICAQGDAVVCCCGVRLPALEAEEPDEAHAVRVERSEDAFYVRADHAMDKAHHLSFFVRVGMDQTTTKALYPEGGAETRFPIRGSGWLYWYCNRHGLFRARLDPSKL